MRIVLAGLAIAASAAIVTGCVYEVIVEHDEIEIDESYQRLEIGVDVGDVRVSGADGLATTISVRLEYHGPRPDLDVRVSDGVLYVDGDCRRSGWHCRTDLELAVPAYPDLLIDTGVGDLTVHDMSGTVDAATETGSIGLQNLTGETTVYTGVGDIVGVGLEGGTIAAETGVGDIDLVAVAPFTAMEATADVGSIQLLVPRGSYNVSADAGLGSVWVIGLYVNPEATRTIVAETDVGDITIAGYDPPILEYLPACLAVDGDPYQLDDAVVDGDTLNVTVRASGGCEDHEWKLCWPDQSFMESYPVQAGLEIWHDDHDDPCDAIITEEVAFDLSPLAQAYFDMYGYGAASIILQLHGFTLQYDF